MHLTMEQAVPHLSQPGAQPHERRRRAGLAVGAWVRQVLKFQPAIAAHGEFYGSMDYFGVCFKASVPAADKTLGIGYEIEPATQFANLEFGFANGGRTALSLLTGFSGHNSHPLQVSRSFLIKRNRVEKGSRMSAPCAAHISR